MTSSKAMSPLHGRQRDGPWRLLHLDRLVENLGHAAQRDAHGRQVRVHPHQRLQRRQETHLVRRERDEGPDGDVATDDAIAAVDEHQAGSAGEEQAGQSTRQVGQPLHRHQRSDERGVAFAKAGDFALLSVRRDDQLHRLQRFDQEAADVRAPLAQGRDLGFQLPAIAGEEPQAQRRGGDRHQEQPHVQPREHHGRAAQEQHVAHPREGGLRGDALDFADVVVDPRHDVADARTGVETGGQPLQVAVHLQPHVEQDVGGHAGVAQAADHVHHEAGGGEQGEQHADANQRPEIAADQGVVEKVPRQERQIQGQRGAERAEQQHQHEAPPVRDDEGERPAQVAIDHFGGRTNRSVVMSPSSVMVRRY